MKKLPIVRWFDDLKSALSIYIAGNVAPSGGVTAGKFYFWNGKVRFPTTNIAAGETLTDSNMPVVPEGGLNKVIELKSTTTNSGKILLERFGNVVCVTFADGTYSNNSNGFLIDADTSQLIILPSGYRPDHTVYAYDKSSDANIQFRSNGKTVALMSNKAIRSTACFITSSNMPW